MYLVKKGFLLSMAYCMLVTQAFAVGYEHVETKDFQLKNENSALIKKAFDTYRYRMTVEWDQNDSTFKDYAKSEFEKDILELKSQGVSLNEIQSFMTSNMLSSKAKADYQALVTTLKKQGKTDAEVASIATKFMENNYQEGASYSAGARTGWSAAGIIIAIVIITVITVIIVKKRGDDDDNGRHHDDCGYNNDYNYCY